MKYKKPEIKTTRVKLNMFVSDRAKDSLSFQFVGQVFAQSGGCSGGTCGCGGSCGNCDARNCSCAGGCTGGCAGSCSGSGNCNQCGCAQCGCGCSQCGAGTCFLAGTKILMADGSKKAIEEIKQGDNVASFNTEERVKKENRVGELIIHSNVHSGYLLVNNILKVTKEHIVFLNASWKAAEEIKVGDNMIGQDGNNITIDSVEFIDGDLDRVYNLHLEGPEHNYFAEGFLVHNMELASSPCFLKGTQILLADGKSKVIEELNEGDLVASIDTESRSQSERKVQKLIIHDDEANSYLIINSLLKVTPNHPIFANNTWTIAEYVKVGDTLMGIDGQNIEVTTIEKKEVALDRVYNLHLEGPEHNYFADGILVHNEITGK